MSTQKGMTSTGEKIDVEVPSIGRPGCANCAFAIVTVNGATNNAEGFECRRYAPRPGIVAAWPGVRPDDWCGMYTSREEFHAQEVGRRQAIGAMRLLQDLVDPEKTPPDNLNG